ncbi:ABC transporter ATP-binding protein [Candidatus Woesearchaeota archaeon]|nr:ABC transporter ATP-binding protein [Candidatus Woesearchaeota archaeon]
MIELSNVWKTYTIGKVDVHALRGLTLNVKRGEFLAVMGPSGSGKSTAMNMIGSLDIPTKGVIKLDGQDISKLHESDLAQIRGQKIGFIFQKFNLLPTFTAKENIMLPMTFQKMSQEEKLKRAENLLSLVGLGDRMNHLPSELSGGQQQRVAIARALANNPEVVLADEPTGNLDTKTGNIVMQYLKKLHKTQGKTIVLVTHDSDIAREAQRIERLRDGALVNTKRGNKK